MEVQHNPDRRGERPGASACRRGLSAVQENHVGKEQLTMEQGESGMSQGRDKQRLPETGAIRNQ